MDPLSITASVVALTGNCLKVTKLMSDLREKFRHAHMMLSAFCSEATVICTTLSQIQTLIMQHSEATVSQLKQRSELLATFDVAITGCMVIFSVLDEEMQNLSIGIEENEMTFTARAKYVWNEDLMKDLLVQLRGQQQGVILLLQAIQMTSVGDIHQLLSKHTLMLERISSQSRSLRSKHPSIKVPPSIFDATQLLESKSISGTWDSTATDTTFLFDDLIINSKVYRRVLAQASSRDLKDDAAEATPVPVDISGRNSLLDESLKEGSTVRRETLRDCEADFLRILREYPDAEKEIARAREDKDFEDELDGILKWFKVISTYERLAATESLLSEGSLFTYSGLSMDYLRGKAPKLELPELNNKRHGYYMADSPPG